jgi:poly(A) polymerase
MRRDFTINGLFRDPTTGEVHDFVDGRADLDAGILRAIGDPADRFTEDHLRMLRAVRFVACLGMQLESATETAIAAHAGELSGVSRERIGEELRRLLQCPRRVEGVALFERLGLGVAVFGTPAADASFSRLECAGHVGAELPALLAAWSLDRGDSTDLESGVQVWRESLLLSNEHRDGMRSCLASHRMFQEWEAMGVAPRKRLASSPWSAAALSMIEAVDPERAATIRRDIDMLATSGLSPARLLDGDTLVADGMPPGIRFGEVLEQVYDAQLEGRIHTLDEAIQLGRELSGR